MVSRDVRMTAAQAALIARALRTALLYAPAGVRPAFNPSEREELRVLADMAAETARDDSTHEGRPVVQGWAL